MTTRPLVCSPRSCLALLLFLVALQAAADHWYVDDDNHTGTEDGTRLAPFTHIQAAINAAASGDTISVAAGIYDEALTIADKTLVLQGGFAGATTQHYSTGQNGDFVTRFAGDDSSRLNGHAQAPTIRIEGDSSGSTIDGFTITGGQRGIELPDWPLLNGLSITNNRIEGNGLADPAPDVGGGIVALGGHTNIRVDSNHILGNRAGRGGGIAGGGINLTLTGNIISDNEGVLDHGGGVYLLGTGSIVGNLIANNRVGEDLGYGWGGGLVVVGNGADPRTDMRISGNRFVGNFAPSAGGGVYIDDGARAYFDHNLLYRNWIDSSFGGSALYVDCLDPAIRSSVEVNHSTFVANGVNATQDGTSAIRVDCSDLSVRNSIIWDNPGNAFNLFIAPTLTVQDSLIQSGWAEMLPGDDGDFVIHPEAWPGVGNLVDIDPLFVAPAQDDYHLRSVVGRWEAALGQWVRDADTSPAIDAAHPASPYVDEPRPNGWRANLGAYGNTAEASLSARDGPVTVSCETGPRWVTTLDVMDALEILSEIEIITSGAVTVHAGASLIIQATQGITIGQGFRIAAGGRFLAIVRETYCPDEALISGLAD
ncbi:hypothetical protein GJ668_16545 [Allochromatium palmeri]|uniref:DUF1565 domain-containing protein n=1 Tax=Allochromatium palmeri TaxID=231048 RepID=A0A6N8EJJ5_9GAMM|nr:hypothetical protein [Allochromatium palmeri]